MVRRRQRPSRSIYRSSDGWILSAIGEMERISDGHVIEVVLYHIERDGDTHITTTKVRNTSRSDGVDRLHRTRCGGKIGEYEGSNPEPNTRFEDQPRAVRMQRHAIDIYDRLGDVRGVSPTICVRAAETFGSTWAAKDAAAWQNRVRSVGAGRAERIADAL